jgi:hypothetical protein
VWIKGVQAGQFDGVKRELLETIQFRAQQLGIMLVTQGVTRPGFQSNSLMRMCIP